MRRGLGGWSIGKTFWGGWIADLGGSGGEWNASVKREFIVVER